MAMNLYVSKSASAYFATQFGFTKDRSADNRGGDSAGSMSVGCNSSYNSIDLLCEGPIEGFVDSNGNTVNYIGLNGLGQSSIDCLAEGVYYNDTQIRDSKSKLYNFSKSEFKASFGNQIKNCSDSVSAVYTYKSKLYDFTNFNVNFTADIDKNWSGLGVVGSLEQSLSETYEGASMAQMPTFRARANYAPFRLYPVTHTVQNKYADLIIVNLSVDSLFKVEAGGSTGRGIAIFGVEVMDVTTSRSRYLQVKYDGVAKGGSTIIPVVVDVSDETIYQMNSRQYVISVYSYMRAELVGDINSNNRSVSLDSIVEYITIPFSFPYSVVVNNVMDSRNFQNIPVRSYDCKLLKIKVPENYDGEAREYVGNWTGDFSKNLKWTDNPAWIFYDICSNSRYGMAKGKITEADLNKWQILTLSKYCDELVKTNAPIFNPQLFYFNNSLAENDPSYNCIKFGTGIPNVETLSLIYPIGSLIYLYDLQNEFANNVDYNFKKRICSLSLEAVAGGYIASLKLCNDFGPRKILEQDSNGELFDYVVDQIKNNYGGPSNNNFEDKIIKFIIAFFTSSRSKNREISKSHMSKSIFDKSLKIAKGYCGVKISGSQDFLEPRFSCNLIMNSQNEGLKTLTDLASIFRGIFYFKNGLLALTSDVKQNPIYIFTNSNVKNGLFTYASGDLNNSFSIAKVPYLDKYDNFKDKIVYVEDSELIQSFGIIEKEILSFGVTSKTEAQRIGKWYLATGKLESEIVSFATGVEATQLQIGNVIRISDALKDSSIVFGKITELDFKNNYIHVDREIRADCLGKIIKIFSIVDDLLVELNFSVIELDNTNLRLKIASRPYMSWFIVRSIDVQDDGLKLTGQAQTNGFNKKVYTNNSFISNCETSFSVVAPQNHLSVVGLSTINDSTVDQTDINYAFQITGNGSTAASLTAVESGGAGVFNQAGSVTITFTIASHGFAVGNYINIFFTKTGGGGAVPVNNVYLVVSVPSVNTFTVTSVVSATVSGTAIFTKSITVQGNPNVIESDVLKITYDGEYIRYYQNQTLVRGPVPISVANKGKPFHAVAAMSYNTTIKNIIFSKSPDFEYGYFSDVKIGANFTIHLDESKSKDNLYKIINITEISANEYGLSAMKYDEEKFNIIENDSYVKKTQKNTKEIVFSSNNTINDLFTDQELDNKRLALSAVSYVQSSSIQYDYNFNIEEETLTEDFNNLKYSQLKIDFIDLFTILSTRTYGSAVFGIMCIITVNGRNINFNVLKNDARFVNVFLGKMQEGSNGAAYQADFYAFNKDYQIFNV